MGRKKSPGLVKRGGVWHIDKSIKGYGRLCESCGTNRLEEANRFLAARLEQIRAAEIYGVRPTRTFAAAAAKYLEENLHKRSIERDRQDLDTLMPFIGELALRQVHMGTLQPFVRHRQKSVAHGTINRSLAVVRRVLNLAARSWRDEHGLTWLETAPLIQLLPNDNARQPYPLSWAEQRLLFRELPGYLAAMALFKVNTGTRDREVCSLRWDWEVDIPELDTSVFVIPRNHVKNKHDRVVVLNSVASSVVEKARGQHRSFVFTYRGRPIHRMGTSGWKRARERAADRYKDELGTGCPDGFRRVRIHDLKHTFGRRLRAVGVSFEDRQDLLGHKSARVTTHYSAAEIQNLVDAAEKVCGKNSRKTPAVTLIRIANRA